MSKAVIVGVIVVGLALCGILLFATPGAESTAEAYSTLVKSNGQHTSLLQRVADDVLSHSALIKNVTDQLANLTRGLETRPGTCSLHRTAVVDCATGGVRKFNLPYCKRSFTIPELMWDFAAHQVEWNIMGKDRAFWSVLLGYPADVNMTQDLITKFYASGTHHVSSVVLPQLQRQYPGYKYTGNILDFGCGLGRLGSAFAMEAGVDAVTCVDQSVHHVLKSNKFVNHNAHKARYLPLVSTPDLLMSLQQRPEIPRCYDLVHSFIVIQHMITPLQAIYLEQFCDILRPGGKLWLHVPYKTPRDPACTEKDRDYYQEMGGMQMHWMAMPDAKTILEARGCDTEVIDMKEFGVDSLGGTKHASMVIMATKRSNVETCVE